MDHTTRTETIHRIIDDAVDAIEQETDMNTVAAYRAMMVVALERLPQMLCSDHLEQDLARFARWIQHERDSLRPAAH